MSPHFNDFLGSSPLVYVRHLMKKFDYKSAPIPVEEISESLKLAIEEIDPPQELATPALHEQLMQASSWLERDAMRIRVYKHAPRKRKRLSICHENTHFIIPYHVGINPFCPDADDPANRKNTEREAFHGAAAQIFYLKIFIPDLLSFDCPSLTAIEQLSDRYDASQEATANWFAKVHPGKCAVIVATIPDPPIIGKNGLNESENGYLLPEVKASSKSSPIWMPKNGTPHINGLPHTLQVNYSISSQRFPNWIPAGRKIPDTSLIFKCWESGENKTGEISASDFGSSSPLKYFAECKPFQANGKPAILTLLWLQDKQLDLAISSPYAGW
ncbi:MAG: hypothetical protein KCHDKBKB_01695 [Elusimicrobia bacterium]|nr:hypothetical protein [Elusimicrobiota bacterium]